jgi:hypothetical protein
LQINDLKGGIDNPEKDECVIGLQEMARIKAAIETLN